MLSKEEIESMKIGLWNIRADNLKAMQCSLADTSDKKEWQKEINVIENALEYIDQLESDKQKLADMYYKCIDKEKGFKKLDGMNCKEALPIINNAIQDMLNNADEYRKLNTKNGWGSYDGLLATLQEMRNCCENNSDGTINVS